MSHNPRNLVRMLARARARLAVLATVASLSAGRSDYSAHVTTLARVRFLECELLAARLPVHATARTYRPRIATNL